MPPRIKAPAPLQHNMRAWRKHRKLTLAQVAEAIGSTKSHMSSIENGIHGLTPTVAGAVAKHLGITVEMLWNNLPGEGADLELDLLALFRGADPAQRRAMVDMARMVRALGGQSAERDHATAASVEEA